MNHRTVALIATCLPALCLSAAPAFAGRSSSSIRNELNSCRSDRDNKRGDSSRYEQATKDRQSAERDCDRYRQSKDRYEDQDRKCNDAKKDADRYRQGKDKYEQADNKCRELEKQISKSNNKNERKKLEKKLKDEKKDRDRYKQDRDRFEDAEERRRSCERERDRLKADKERYEEAEKKRKKAEDDEKRLRDNHNKFRELEEKARRLEKELEEAEKREEEERRKKEEEERKKQEEARKAEEKRVREAEERARQAAEDLLRELLERDRKDRERDDDPVRDPEPQPEAPQTERERTYFWGSVFAPLAQVNGLFAPERDFDEANENPNLPEDDKTDEERRDRCRGLINLIRSTADSVCFRRSDKKNNKSKKKTKDLPDCYARRGKSARQRLQEKSKSNSSYNSNANSNSDFNRNGNGVIDLSSNNSFNSGGGSNSSFNRAIERLGSDDSLSFTASGSLSFKGGRTSKGRVLATPSDSVAEQINRVLFGEGQGKKRCKEVNLFGKVQADRLEIAAACKKAQDDCRSRSNDRRRELQAEISRCRSSQPNKKGSREQAVLASQLGAYLANCSRGDDDADADFLTAAGRCRRRAKERGNCREYEDAGSGFVLRLGDQDGFGFGSASGLFAAANKKAQRSGQTVLANKDGEGILGTGDYLPDLDGDGTCQTYRKDDFDHRSAQEKGSSASVALNCEVIEVRGSQFTDIALSTSFDDSVKKNQVRVGPGSYAGAGVAGPFPRGRSKDRSNQPSESHAFVFEFTVAARRIDKTQPVFFNLVFGDYDVNPAELRFEHGSRSFTLPVVRQENSKGEDGLIQAAFSKLAFDDVFDDDGSGVYRGSLKVHFVAPNEPYTAFDFVELSTEQIDIENPPSEEDFVLNVTGDLAYRTAGSFDMTSHAGEIRVEQDPQEVPELEIDDTRPASNGQSFDFDGGANGASFVLNSMIVNPKGEVKIKGAVTLTVYGDVELPRGAVLNIQRGASLILETTGDIVLLGEIRNDNLDGKGSLLAQMGRAGQRLKIVTLGESLTFRVDGGNAIGSFIGRDINFASLKENGKQGNIDFVFDKAQILRGVKASLARLKRTGLRVGKQN